MTLIVVRDSLVIKTMMVNRSPLDCLEFPKYDETYWYITNGLYIMIRATRYPLALPGLKISCVVRVCVYTGKGYPLKTLV